MDGIVAAIERVAEFETVVATKRVRTIVGRSVAECMGQMSTLPGMWMVEEIHRQPDRYQLKVTSFVFGF